MDRGHDDFSGRDLVDDILVESLGRVGLSNPTPMPTTYETANKSYLDSTRSGRVIKGDIGFPLGTTRRIHVHGITHHVVRHVCVYGRVGVCARERWGWPGAKTGSLSLNASFARFCPLLPVFFFALFTCPRAHLRPLSAALWLGSACLGSLGTVKLRLAWADRGFVAEPHRLGRSSPRQQDDPGHLVRAVPGPPNPGPVPICASGLGIGSCLALSGQTQLIHQTKDPRFVWCNPSPSSSRLNFDSTDRAQPEEAPEARPAQQPKYQTFFLHTSKNALRHRPLVRARTKDEKRLRSRRQSRACSPHAVPCLSSHSSLPLHPSWPVLPPGCIQVPADHARSCCENRVPRFRTQSSGFRVSGTASKPSFIFGRKRGGLSCCGRRLSPRDSRPPASLDRLYQAPPRQRLASARSDCQVVALTKFWGEGPR